MSVYSRLFIISGLVCMLYFYHGQNSSASIPLGSGGWAPPLDNGLLGLTGTRVKHPIQLLVEQAKAKHARMVERQSTTLEEAITEYKRRYSRNPPPGFDHWYKAAVEANVPIIDEYDTVMAAFEPFWSISGKEIRARVQEAIFPPVGKTPVIGVHLQDNNVSLTYNGNMFWPWRATIFKDWVEHHMDHIPDMDIAFNIHDEPEVVIPRDELDRSLEGCPAPQRYEFNRTKEQVDMHDLEVVYFDSLQRHREWDRGIQSCPLNSGSRSRQSSKPDKSADCSEGPQFVQNVTRAKDVCEETDAVSLHGFFTSPDGFVLTSSLVPIFSKSKVSSFQDLLLPAVDYDSRLSEGTYKEYSPDEDMPWKEKKNRLYWAGTSFDGYYQNSNWKNMQRVRLVRDSNDANLPVSLLRRNDKSRRWEAHNDTMGSLSKYIDVKFTAQDMCDEKTCEEMKDPKNGVVWKDKEPFTEPYANRFLMDIDGHAFTERFRRLLSSRSVVFKMSIFQEWHHDFLEPWVHYVPITLGMKELPETLRFLAETPEGQAIAKDIAEAGREWVGKAWRVVDMRIATFRILLEYARLYGEERDHTGECPWDRKERGEKT